MGQRLQQSGLKLAQVKGLWGLPPSRARHRRYGRLASPCACKLPVQSPIQVIRGAD